jgi:hypothetical protein
MKIITHITITRETELEDGSVVGEENIDIEASYYAGCDATYWNPADHPEVEILSASISGEEVELTAEEEERIVERILNDPPDLNYGDY